VLRNRILMRGKAEATLRCSKINLCMAIQRCRASILLYQVLVKQAASGIGFQSGVFANMQEVATRSETGLRPAAYQVDLGQETRSGERGRLMVAYLTIREHSETPKLTVVLQHVGVWSAMLLFSGGFYYGLARLVIWAASL
jgi:hypothetical protein